MFHHLYIYCSQWQKSRSKCSMCGSQFLYPAQLSFLTTVSGHCSQGTWYNLVSFHTSYMNSPHEIHSCWSHVSQIRETQYSEWGPGWLRGRKIPVFLRKLDQTDQCLWPNSITEGSAPECGALWYPQHLHVRRNKTNTKTTVLGGNGNPPDTQTLV